MKPDTASPVSLSLPGPVPNQWGGHDVRGAHGTARRYPHDEHTIIHVFEAGRAMIMKWSATLSAGTPRDVVDLVWTAAIEAVTREPRDAEQAEAEEDHDPYVLTAVGRIRTSALRRQLAEARAELSRCE